jgi:hypothetical protein
MPKTFEKKVVEEVPQSEVDMSIDAAVQNQGDHEDQQTEEQLDAKISGSGGIWESQAQLHGITEKLTRTKDYKTPEQLAKEKKLQSKLEMQKIRDQILAVEPVGDMDTKLFSDYLADQSDKSKSSDEIKEEQEKLKKQ